MRKKTFGLTLIELLITVVLVGLVVMAFVSIQRFSVSNVIASDRRAKLQNEGHLILEHITKSLSRAKGHPYCQEPMDCMPVWNGSVVGAWGEGPDFNHLMIRLDDNNTATPEDDNVVNYLWVTIEQAGSLAPCYQRYSMSYCDRLDPSQFEPSIGGMCGSDDATARDPLSCGHVANFTPALIDNATVAINLTMRHDPNQPAGIDNPEVNLTTVVHIPGAPSR